MQTSVCLVNRASFCCLLSRLTLRHTSHSWAAEIRIEIWRDCNKKQHRSCDAKANKLFSCITNMRCLPGKLLLIHSDTLKSDSNNIIRSRAGTFWLIDLFCAATFAAVAAQFKEFLSNLISRTLQWSDLKFAAIFSSCDFFSNEG